MKELGWIIISLVISVALICSGLSGEGVLRGTNSSAALVAVGTLFLLYDIYLVATYVRKRRQQKEYEARQAALSQAILYETNPAMLSSERQIKIHYQTTTVFIKGKYALHLNGQLIGQISAKNKCLTWQTQRVNNVLQAITTKGVRGCFCFEILEGSQKTCGIDLVSTDGVAIFSPTSRKSGIREIQFDAVLP